MNRDQLVRAADEARRFIDRAEAAIARLDKDDYRAFYAGTAESGAVRRASMDLTRELARLRRWER